MTGLTSSGEKRLVLVSGRAHPALARDVAQELGTELVPTTAYDFANGEIYVRFEESVRGCDAFVLQSHTTPINQWLMEQLLMVDALKRASAKRITVVAPFYPYARPDKKHRGRAPISARFIADMFHTAGADRLMSIDLHAAQVQRFFDGPVGHLWAMPLLTAYVRTRPAHVHPPPRRRGPGLLRRPARPPVGEAEPHRLRPRPRGHEHRHGRRARRRPHPRGGDVGGEARRRTARLHPQDPGHRPPEPGGGQPGGR